MYTLHTALTSNHIDETSPLRPASPYAASKAAAEMLCRQYETERGIGITVARVFNLVGPGQPVEQVPSEFCRQSPWLN